MQGLTGAAANQLATKALQDYLVHDAKIDPDSPEGKTLMELASVAIGTAFGGGSGAATALYGEQFNRQLHPDEFKWIDENAEKFAAQLYGCDQACTPEQIQTAKNRLIIEAGARVDAVMADRAGGVDEAAQAFINTNPVKFAWGEGFTATREQYYDFKYFGDLLSRDKQAFIDLAEALDSAGWGKREFQAAYHDQLLAAADRARGESGQAIIENFTGDVGLVLGIVRKLTEGDTDGAATDSILAALPWGISKAVGGLRPIASAGENLVSLNGKAISDTWVSAKGELTWIHPLTGAREVVPDNARVHVDHILPQNAIKEIDGFTSLPKDVQKQLLNDPANLQPMIESANCSKGCRVEMGSDGWMTWNGQPVSDGYREYLEDAQREFRNKVNKTIAAYMAGGDK
ncbi:hypothetical protein EDC50_2431 [Vulcaniibacterium tengchongense]|uniref:Uncharacterized protein n=1 Tax=Vulcaniibacterium tengchongense TaxID=1273429 RepID=A0A3N4VTM5_9GAMM|nr:hypothetical protein EDC50_2431 [Vulcaniibacterium tengchongense]